MLLFATDLVNVDFVPSDHPDDKDFLSALASFETPASAHEARDRLHGKVNAANEANMVVEMLQNGVAGTIGMRRNTIDGPPLSASSSSIGTTNTATTTASTGNISRQTSYSISSDGSSSNRAGPGLGNRSRFNGTFQSLEQSPPAPPSTAPSTLGTGVSAAVANGGNEFPAPDATSQFNTLFSPQSPLGGHQLHQNPQVYGSGGEQAKPRVTGKSVINDDLYDAETGELLKDPVAYAKNGQTAGASVAYPSSSAPTAARTRRPTNPQIPTSRLARMSLTSPVGGPLSSPASSMPAYSPSTFGGPVQPSSSSSAASPAVPSTTASSNALDAGAHATQKPYQSFMPSHMPSHKQFQPHASSARTTGFPSPLQSQQQQQPQIPHYNFSPNPTYPPVNPADQNPPCNTLYVGNLPVDTSEDELKAMFSKQRGYKRLCFRTKQNGPMCFVEFEDVSFATKALNELYGQLLHNSFKGGIRLSFSKNPLGVRAGQQGNSSTGSGSANGMAGMAGLSNAGMGLGVGTGMGMGMSPMMGANVGSGIGVYGGFVGVTGVPNVGYSPQQQQQAQQQAQAQAQQQALQQTQQHMVPPISSLEAGIATPSGMSNSVSPLPSVSSQPHSLVSPFSTGPGNQSSLVASPTAPAILNGLGAGVTAISSTGAPVPAATAPAFAYALPSSSSIPALSSGGFGRSSGHVGIGGKGAVVVQESSNGASDDGYQGDR